MPRVKAMGWASFTSAAMEKQRERGRSDARAGNAFGHNDEAMSYEPGDCRERMKGHYLNGWKIGRGEAEARRRTA